MNTKKLLTSFAVFGIMSMPAMADIASNAESATCDSGTVGVSEGSTILEAQWTAQQIQCAAGTYLESDTAQCTACPAGSYCEGGLYTFSGSDLGITGACESGYTSDGSAASTADCYRSCTTADVAHSTAVSGKYYYGDNNQCAPTSCAAGYTAKAGLDLSNANLTFTNGAYGCIDNSASYKTGKSQTVHDQAYYGLTENNTWARESAEGGIIYGQARCSTQQGTSNGSDRTTFANLANETGETGAQYCYCNITGYKADNSSALQSLSSSWVFFLDRGSASGCASGCADNCASNVGSNAGFRSALFGAVQALPASCEANTIGITWKPQNGESNIVDQCTYDGAVTIPATPSKVGYDFAGWHVNNAQ